MSERRETDHSFGNNVAQTIKVAETVGKVGLNVCVFCSASDLPDRFTKPAERLAQLIAEHGHTLVWGGSNVGLMKIMASGAQAGGAKIVGVSVEFLKDKARKNADEMVVAKDLGERKATLLERSDVIVMLVGGSGTLDEVTDVIELKKHGLHNKPIVALNTDGFYEGLEMQFHRMQSEGMLPMPLEKLIYFSPTPEDAIAYINQFQPTT